MKTNAKYDDENLIELFLDKVITEEDINLIYLIVVKKL